MGIGYRPSKRLFIFRLYNWKCVYCNKDLRYFRKQSRQIDHAIPVSLGGAKYDTENLRACCILCNFDKGEMTESDYLEYLATCLQPSALRGKQNEDHLLNFGTDWNPDSVPGIQPNNRHDDNRFSDGRHDNSNKRRRPCVSRAVRRNRPMSRNG